MPETHQPSTLRRRAMRALLMLFYIAIAVVLVAIGRRLEWAEAIEVLRTMPAHGLLLATACSAAAYTCYVGYELLAARHVRIALPTSQVAAIGFVSYTSNLNFGAILGALGVRLRLYAARGVDTGDTTRMIAFNLLTNWSGYVFALGLALLVFSSEPPASWRIGEIALRASGIGMLALGMAYLWACARATRRSFHVRGHEFELPSFREALLQFALSVPAWLATAASVYFLLRAQVAFDLVLITLLASAVAGLVVRVPAGLGVIEAVFIASLASSASQPEVLAALLAFRCVHYLGPLVVGIIVFGLLHLGAMRTKRAS